MMKTYHSRQNRPDYMPPILGNGQIALSLDGEGAQSICMAEKDNPGGSPAQTIYWAGRRYMDEFTRPLIPFGRFIHSLPQADDFEQTLDTERALLTTRSHHGALTLETLNFLCMDKNLLIMKKTFSQACEYALTWLWADSAPHTALPRRVSIQAQSDETGIDVRFSLDGQQQSTGGARLQADRPVCAEVQDNRFTLRVSVQSGETVTFAFMIADSLDGGDWENRLNAMRTDAENTSTLQAAHEQDWLTYSKKSYVSFGEEAIESAWQTALYHLRCYTTRWSIPVGLNDTHWQSRYFAFDEYFSLDGLLTSGHDELARRVSDFRLAGLRQAQTRASRFNYPISISARYPWETVETGEEAAPVGFWYDHVFHMGSIALGAWRNARYAGDTALLERYWDMIKSCAAFFLRHMVYRLEGGRVVIGKCTDLERLGCDVENAYMTTCAAIETLRIAANAAEILNCDAEFAQECLETADALFDSLPCDGQKYVPFPDCEQKSIAVFTGTYPYGCIPAEDAYQIRAMRDYIGNELTYGNMYNFGSGVASWYAAWKAIVYARLSDCEHALPALYQAVAERGCFDEMWEINEEAVRLRPWFTTASGTLLTGVNAMLLNGDDDVLTIAPALHKRCESFSFSLPARGGLWVECIVRDNVLERLTITGQGCAQEQSVRVRLPKRINADCLPEEEMYIPPYVNTPLKGWIYGFALRCKEGFQKGAQEGFQEGRDRVRRLFGYSDVLKKDELPPREAFAEYTVPVAYSSCTH